MGDYRDIIRCDTLSEIKKNRRMVFLPVLFFRILKKCRNMLHLRSGNSKCMYSFLQMRNKMKVDKFWKISDNSVKNNRRQFATKMGQCSSLPDRGSGKTTVIVHRVKHLIEKDGVSGSHILVITFTKAAANEMHARFEQLSGQHLGVTFGTFHSVFFMILRKAYGYDASNIIQEAEKYQIVRNIIEKKNLNYDGQEDFAKNVIAEIGYVKSEMVNIDTYESSNMKPEDFRLVYQAYEDMLRKENKIDFDDMLVFYL